jgi:L-ascorbate metabolism protein UlaG (beta-lactamase superfamily)
MRKQIWSAIVFAAFCSASSAQEPGPHPPFVSSPRRILVPPELLDAPDEWIDRSLQWVESILEHYPSGNPEIPVRRAALIRLDDILHIKSAPAKPLVQQFYRMRMERAIAEIEHTKVTDGMRIWKLYNHGFLIRTPTVSFTFDIVPGTREPGFNVSKELLERLANQSDATFISHLHGDHANQEVARIFLDKHKPVIAPEGLWSDVPDLASRLTYPKRSVSEVHDIPIQNGERVLKVVSYPGHQGKAVLVNVNLVTTPEGFTVLQTGDQSGEEGPGSDFDWMAQIGRDHHVDVLMPNAWANGLQRIVRGVNPELVITGHENEMGHAVDHREDYTQTYTHLFNVRYPFLVMTWGESYLYRGPEIPLAPR